MPDTQECESRRPEDMSDEALRQILREDASKPEGEDTDMEWILHAMEVLATRRKERGEGKSPAEALESFNKNYCTNQENNLISEKVRGIANKHANGLWKRLAALAAVLVLVIGLGAVTASAWDFDLWEIVSKWTQETFHFGAFGEDLEQNGQAPCASLQAALDESMVTQKLVPTWLPEGYEEAFLDVQENPKQRRFLASYKCGDKEIMIRITDYLGMDPNQVEQSDSLMEVYVSNGLTYYIFSNYDRLRAVWIHDSFECQITGALTVDEIKLMIDSIGRE